LRTLVRGAVGSVWRMHSNTGQIGMTVTWPTAWWWLQYTLQRLKAGHTS